MYAAMSFSILYFSMACAAQSIASCCMSSANKPRVSANRFQRADSRRHELCLLFDADVAHTVIAPPKIASACDGTWLGI